MAEKTPNYSQYTLYELNSALAHIDREQYPDRVELIEEAIFNFPSRVSEEKPEKSKDNSFFAMWLRMEFITWVVVSLFVLAWFSIF